MNVSAAALNASPQITNFAVYAQNSATLRDRTTLSGGDIGVHVAGTGPFLITGYELALASGVQVDATHNTIANRLLLQGAKVGDVQTNTLAVQNGGTYAKKYAFPTTMPALPALAQVFAGTVALTVNVSSTTAISPGAYGAVTIGSKGILRLQGGVYHWASLQLDDDARIEALAPVQIRVAGRVAGRLSTLARVWIGAAAGVTLAASDLRIEVSGKNGTGGGLTETPIAAVFGTDAIISGVILVPSGTLQLGQRNTVTGALVGRDVYVDMDSKVIFQSGPAVLKCAQFCNDGNPCTKDTCTGEVCSYPALASGTSCSDGNPCNGAETCDGAGKCKAGTPISCTAQDQCHAAGVCDPTTGVCSNPTKTDGTSCNDGNACTVSDICRSGTCSGTTYSCDDGLACTTDTCKGDGTCTHAIAANNCAISGACYAASALNPTNSCQQCTPATSTSNWTSKSNGAACNDGNGCTKNDICTGGSCSGTAYSCDDKIACTNDVCNGDGTCSHPVAAGSCLIGGACYAANATNPSNQCQQCTPATSQTAWSPKNPGTACNDGNACTKNDVCTGSACGGTAYGCDDGLACTADSCNGDGTCNHTVAAGNCAINGTCYANGASNPANACKVCKPAQATTSWSNQGDGTSCNDGNACTKNDVCTAGTCGGTAYSCDDGLACTADSCNGDGTCSHAIAAGNCAIGGVCYGANATSPTNQCQLCAPSTSQTGWSPANGTACNDGEPCTQTDTCLAGACTGSNLVTCTASDQCHDVGSCIPGVGTCSNPAKTDGAPCDDGVAASQGDACTAGVCQGTIPCASVADIHVGAKHSCIVRTDGSLWCWGDNSLGQLGTGTISSSGIPVRAGATTWNWTSVTSGGYHTCAIRRDGTLWCWGDNAQGQLGNGTTDNTQIPSQVVGQDWVMVQAGLQYTCGVQQNGSLWCWGDNAHGGLGNGTQDNSLVPVEVVGMGWVSVAAGAWHTCGIKADQTLWCWGGNSAGEVGNGGTDDSLTPVQIGGTDWQSVSVGVATGSFHTCGVKLDGSLWCWGENSAGQLGTGSTAGSVTPVQVGSATWTNMSGGNLHTCGVESDGTLWCWGDNEQGQIGDGTLTNRLAPARVPGQAWAQVAAGNVHTCGRRQDGSLWCWGWNGEGEIGDGTTDTHQAPTQVAGSLCGQVPICGNGVKEPGEQCDDGNNVPGDGCTMDCQVEKCFNPNCPEPDACHDKGVCDPATGNCSNPSKEDGASCGQGNAGICQQGVCLGGGAPSSVNPVFNCLAIDATGVTFAVFGYVNGTGGNIHVPLGAENVMTPASVAVPPTWFAPGEHRGVLVAALSGGNVSWQIGSSVAEAHQDSTPICPVVLTPQGDAADLGGGDRAPLRPLDPGDLATLSVVDTEVDSKGMAAGPLSGRFAVNADGAATYVLPLNVPEGRAGMGPKLALQYNSQGGNGMIGVGWSLAGGFSQIARCRKIHAVDGEARAVQFDDSDRFCLDGEYLVASPDKTLPGSGVTEYRTERDPFVRISVSQKDALGPTSFLVEYGDGRKLTYDTLMEGNRATVVANHAKFDPTWATYATVRYAWLLSKVVDSVGNTMTIDYTGDGEEMLPKTFSYTSFVTPFGWRLLPALRQVVLTYVDRPDPSDSWVSGYQLKSSRLLKIIEVRGPAPNSIGTLFKYLLDYKNHSVTGNSLLSSVTECDAKGVCKPAATFDWEVGSSAFRSGAGLYLPEKENLGGSLKFADIDGDGLPDLLYMTGTTLKYGHASEGINIVTGTLEVVFDASYNDETGITTGSTPPSLDDVTPMDIDGDGKAELVVRQVEKGMSWLRYYKYDGTNFNLIPDDGNEIPDVGPYVYVADLDGDGLPELIRAVNYASPQYPDWRWAYRKIVGGVLGPYSQLGGSAALSQYNNYVGDLDGSGRTSILFRGGDTNDTRYLWASLSNNNVESGASTVPWVARSGNDGMGKVLLDLNADGVADAVEYPVTDSLSESSAYFVNTGNGMLGGTANFATPIAVGQMISAGAGGNDRFIVMDVNQDGRDDIVSAPAGVSPDAGPLRAFLSNGKGLSSPTTISEAGEVINWGGAGDGKLFRAIDLNGDGLTDFVMQNGEYLEVHMHDGKKADMITAFHSATGASTSVTYSPWKETSSLSPGCNYPVRCPKRGLWVVSEHKVDPGAGNGSPALFDYGYSSAHIDVLGRGWLGFTEQSTTDKQTNGNRLVRTENYSRWGTSYPFVGRPSRVTDTVTLDDGRILTSKSEMSYGVIAGNILQAGQTYAIGLQSVLYHESETASGSGVETTVRQISESMQYDSYGNVSYRERDGSSTFDSTQSSYLNDTANWILSPPTSRTWVSKSSGESMSRAKSWTYDGGPARLLKTATVQPGGDASQRLDITYTRNPLGLPVTITAVDLTGEQRMTTIQYDAIESSRPVVVTDPAGFVTRTAFHTGLNLPVWQLDQNGLTTTWTYDGFGRIRVASPPSRDDVSTSYKVPSTGGVFEIDRSRVSGGRSSVVYDSLGRAVRGSWATANGKTSVVTASYDARFPGKLARLSIPRFDDDPAPDRFTVATYDFAGRIKTVTDPDATFSRFEYEGLETTTYDRKGNKSYVAADELGRVVKSKQWTAASDPGGAREIPVTYQIGPFGVIRRIQDAKGNNIWSTYDDLGRKTNMTDPDAGWRKYTYSAFGDLLSEEDPKGKTTLSHDADGRPTGAVSPDGTTKLVWDSAANGLGALAATTSADRVIRTMAYDTLSRPTSATWEIEDEFYTGEQTYDGFGRLYTVTYPDTPGWTRFKTEYQYAGNGDLLSLTDVPSAGAQARLFWKADDRDAAGRLKLEEFGNKVTTTQYGIDEDRGVVTGITTKSGDVTVQSLGFAYDANLNLSDRTDSLTGVLEHFDYDALDRLQTWQEIGSLGWKVTYSHDDIGNLTGRSLLGSKGETEDLTFEHSGVNAGPHAVTGSAWGSYEYDTKGNQTKSPEGIIDYTVFNLPKQITGSVTTSYKYDASGTRVLKRSSGNTGTTVYVGALYERRGDAGSRSHVLYLNAAGRRIGQVLRKEADNSEQVQYIHGDVLGSSETVTDDSGKLVGQARKYDPFGGPTDLNLPKAFPGGALMSGDVHLGFTGHEEDSETGLINMRGRIYNPRVGHFLTPDPFLPNPMSSIGLGRYSYALNNPLTYTDPTGFEPVDYGGQLYSEGDKLPSKNGAVFEYDDEQVHSDLVMVFGDHQVVADRRTRISFDDEQVVADTRTGGIGFSPYDSSTWTPGQNGVEMCGAGGFCGMQRRWPGGGVQRDNDTWVDVPLKGGFVQTLPMGVYQDQYEYRPDNSNKLTVDFNRAQVADGPNNTVTVNGPSRSTPVQGMSAATSRGGGNGVGPSAAARDAWAEVAKLHALAAQIPNGILMPRAEPRGVSMAANIELGRQHFGDLIWFAQQVHTGGPMDYKQMGRQYEEFGNMNYGAVGRALGVPEQVLLRAAGAVQIQSGTSDPAFGGPLDTHGPFGDDPVDQFWVHQGARLYEMRASEP